MKNPIALAVFYTGLSITSVSFIFTLLSFIPSRSIGIPANFIITNGLLLAVLLGVGITYIPKEKRFPLQLIPVAATIPSGLVALLLLGPSAY